MINCTVDILGTDYKIALIEFNFRRKTVKLIVIKKPSGSVIAAKAISNIKTGKELEIIDDHFTFVESFDENQLTLAIGNKSDEFTIGNEDTNVLGYAKSYVNTVLPGHLVLVDDAITFRNPYLPLQRNLANTDYQLYYDATRKEVKLLYKGRISNELQPFDPHKNADKFIVTEKVSNSKWISGSPQDGIKFDATDSGDVDSPDDYAVYNDFYIRKAPSLLPQYFSIVPTMVIKTTVGNPFTLKGMGYYPTILEGESINLLPVFIRTLIPAITSAEVTETIKETIKKQRSDEVLQLRRWVNRSFRSKFGFVILKSNELSTYDILEPCNTEEDFNNRIGSLNILIDLMDVKKILEKIDVKDSNENKSISALELFLKHFFEGDYNKKIIENLRTLKCLRMKLPFHPDSDRFYETVLSLGITPPIDWRELWDISLNLYLDSLKLLQESIKEKND